MTILKIHNPFNAPVYHEEILSSTMEISRSLAAEGAAHGTVITADFQTTGRGRIRSRVWEAEEEKGLLFTIMLRYPDIQNIPAAVTLRTGLAVALAIEDFAPSLLGTVTVKWPNDIMIGSKKAVGILCEADGGNLHIGIGINVAQKDFSGVLKEKAGSIAAAAGRDIAPADRFLLLEKTLARLYTELETEKGKTWKSRLEKRLYKKGEQVAFIEGAADSGKKITGCLSGIGEGGELLIVPDGETQALSFITGELMTGYNNKNMLH
ncbi:MAG: biotin--[acetyl-CoA-carboxylase] ligase [Treponema sp.]|jgi:BirA family biotin operon repressor/biotin-[acetyl-CoA-carboxylase] ligase|nr:biotin--[acetyl-CoA-carboxylase] ligase [Treponema sp.]